MTCIRVFMLGLMEVRRVCAGVLGTKKVGGEKKVKLSSIPRQPLELGLTFLRKGWECLDEEIYETRYRLESPWDGLQLHQSPRVCPGAKMWSRKLDAGPGTFHGS